jgi:hypothetical protein
MNEHTESQPLAELAALLRKVEELEAEHRELQSKVSRRPLFSASRASGRAAASSSSPQAA